MTDQPPVREWQATTAEDVRVGDHVRLGDFELTVSRIEPTFLGRLDTLAFVEDTELRWLKAPSARDSQIEVRRGG